MKKFGLALGGGGAKGICHIAFLKVIDELGITPAVISGTSIGAIIGGFYSAGLPGLEIEHELEGLGLLDVYRMAMDFSVFSQSAILKGKGVEEYLMKKIPVGTFEELSLPLKVVATDFWNRRQVVFESGELGTALRASIAMPGIFEPVIMDRTVLVDGGAVNPLPYDLIQPECDFTIAIDVSGEKAYSEDDPVPNMVENILSTFQIMQAAILEAKMKLSPPDLYVKPSLTDIRVLDFHRHKEILDGVREDAVKFRMSLEKLMDKA